MHRKKVIEEKKNRKIYQNKKKNENSKIGLTILLLYV